jgi:hypothetical protein
MSGVMSCIDDRFVFIGSARDAHDRSQLEKNKITRVLNVANDIPVHFIVGICVFFVKQAFDCDSLRHYWKIKIIAQ